MSMRRRTVTVISGAAVATAVAGAAAFAAVPTPSDTAPPTGMSHHMDDIDGAAMEEMQTLMEDGASFGEMQRWMVEQGIDIGQMHRDMARAGTNPGQMHGGMPTRR